MILGISATKVLDHNINREPVFTGGFHIDVFAVPVEKPL